MIVTRWGAGKLFPPKRKLSYLKCWPSVNTKRWPCPDPLVTDNLTLKRKGNPECCSRAGHTSRLFSLQISIKFSHLATRPRPFFLVETIRRWLNFICILIENWNVCAKNTLLMRRQYYGSTDKLSEGLVWDQIDPAVLPLNFSEKKIIRYFRFLWHENVNSSLVLYLFFKTL